MRSRPPEMIRCTKLSLESPTRIAEPFDARDMSSDIPLPNRKMGANGRQPMAESEGAKRLALEALGANKPFYCSFWKHAWRLHPLRQNLHPFNDTVPTTSPFRARCRVNSTT